MTGNAGTTIWDELPISEVDTEKLEFLFESRAKDLQSKVRNFNFKLVVMGSISVNFQQSQRGNFFFSFVRVQSHVITSFNAIFA